MSKPPLKDRLSMEPISEIGGRRGCLAVAISVMLIVLAAMAFSWLVTHP